MATTDHPLQKTKYKPITESNAREVVTIVHHKLIALSEAEGDLLSSDEMKLGIQQTPLKISK